MHRIKQIEIKGFKEKSRRALIRLNGYENISVVFGENGVGKTTLLKILFAIFSHDEDTLKKENVEEINLLISEDDNLKEYYLKIRKIKQNKIVVKSKGKDEELFWGDYDWKEYDNSVLAKSKSLSIGIERGISTQYIKVDPQNILRFFRHYAIRERFIDNIDSFAIHLADYLNRDVYDLKKAPLNLRRNESKLEEDNIQFGSINIDVIEYFLLERYKYARLITNRKIQNALFDTLALIINQEPNTLPDVPYNFINQIVQNKKRLVEALSDTEDNNQFKKRLLDIIQNIDEENYEEIYSSNQIITRLLIKMIEELENENQLINSVKLILDSFNSFLSNGKKIIVEENKLEIRIGNRSHSLKELSSGERHLLTFLVLISIDNNKRDFIIIDEPEISLNINWQRELLPLLSKLVPQTQIIVASHSPSISYNNSNYLSELIVMEEKY